MKLYKNPPSGSRDDTRRWTDGQTGRNDEANIRLSQIFEFAFKKKKVGLDIRHRQTLTSDDINPHYAGLHQIKISVIHCEFAEKFVYL